MNGNISTSAVKPRKEYIELELKPRFPLFGGWQSSYALGKVNTIFLLNWLTKICDYFKGYSVPSYPYLFRKPSGEFVLKIRLLDHLFDDVAVDQLETRIVLPVGVSDIKVKAPYEVKRLPDGVTYKYLDNIGR